VGGKAECLLAIGEEKKVSFLEWTSPYDHLGCFAAISFYRGFRYNEP